MDHTAAIGAALFAMRPHDGRRYEGCLMLSALPQAPTTSHRPTFRERLRRQTRRGTASD